MNNKAFIKRIIWRGKLFASFWGGLYNMLKLSHIKQKNECFIILTGSIGDDVYGMSYVHELKKQNNKKLIIYCSPNRTRLVECYKVADEIRPIYTGCMLISFHKSLIDLSRKLNIYSILPDYYLPMELNGEKNCLDIMRCDMLKIKGDVTIHFPSFENERITSIPNINEICDKIVLLNYSSKSMSQADVSFFQSIANDLHDRGFLLYTNVIGDQKPLQGSLPLNCSIYELYAICNKIKAVISVRTGILDVCASTKAPFLVYNFPFIGRNQQYNEGWRCRYNMNAWGKNNVIECYVENGVDAISFYNTFRKQYLD